MRTINRVPFTVDKPKTDYKFFNQHNWKGINSNKNYFDIDQETFEDCQNVYINEDGVLSSRPVVKVMTDTGLQDIVDMWVFGDIKAYKTTDKLIIADGTKQYSINAQSDVKLIMFDNKLLIFSNEWLKYYKDGGFYDGTELIYIPETTIYTNGIKSESAESKNILTNSEITTYLYNNVDKISNLNLRNEYVEITVGKDIYHTKFTPILRETLFSKKYQLDQNSFLFKQYNYRDDGNFTQYHSFLGDNGSANFADIPLVSVREYNSQSVTLVSIIEREYLNTAETEYIDKQDIYYSLDNLVFYALPYLEGIINLPVLAIDSAICVVAKSDGLYCISLIADDKYTNYSEWTKFADFTIPRYAIDNNELIIPNNAVGLHVKNVENYACVFYNSTVSNTGEYKLTFTLQGKSNNVEIIKNFVADTLKTSSGTSNNGYVDSNAIVFNRPIALGVEYIDSTIFLVGKFLYLSKKNYQKKYISVFDVVANEQHIFKHFITQLLSQGLSTASNYVSQHLSSLYFRNECILTSPVVVSNDVYNFYYKTVLESLVYNMAGEARVYLWLIHTNYDITASGITEHTNTVNEKSMTAQVKLMESYEHTFVISQDSFISNQHYYSSTDNYRRNTPIIAPLYPVYSNTYITTVHGGYLYSTNLSDESISIKQTTVGDLTNTYFDNLVYLNQLYGSIDNTLYISSTKYDDNNNALLYFTEDNKHIFNNKITNLHQISLSQVAVFLKNEIWYTDIQKLNDDYVYTINRSKLNVGCKQDTDIVTTLDGKYIIFPSDRGLVAMGYQDFIASTEQTLIYLSDAILDRFLKFSEIPVKLNLYKYWLYCYNSNGIYVFDFRSNSWWYFDLIADKIVTDNIQQIVIKNGLQYTLCTSDNEYYDEEYVNSYKDVNWFLKSQKLHLGTLNYTKNVVNMTFNLLDSGDEGYNSMKLKVNNYRLRTSETDFETLLYDIDVLRTYVKRLNYTKINQFQYELQNDDTEANPKPLRLDSISIKYKISGQVK